MHIALVDDRVKTLMAHQMLIESLGHSTTLFASGKACLDAFQKGFTCDLILSDITMNGLSGYELFRQLGPKGRNTSIPFVFVSDKERAVDRVWAQRMGADGFIEKPLTSEKLNHCQITAPLAQIEEATAC